MQRITNRKALTALAVAGALDKGGWKDAFVQVGAAGKKDIGVGMEPVGYSDSNTYTAFIRSSFRTKEKADLFSWHTGEELEDMVEPEAGRRDHRPVDQGGRRRQRLRGAEAVLHLRRQAVLRAAERRLLGDVLQQEGLQPKAGITQTADDLAGADRGRRQGQGGRA